MSDYKELVKRLRDLAFRYRMDLLSPSTVRLLEASAEAIEELVVTELTDTDVGVVASIVWPVIEATGDRYADDRARVQAHQKVSDWLRSNISGGVFFDLGMSMIAVRGRPDVVFVPGDRVCVVAGAAFREVAS